MIKDLDAIYSGDQDKGNSAPPAAPPRNLDKMDTSAPLISAGNTNINTDDYIGYMPQGVYTNRKPVDFIRGENQPWYEQLGKRALDIIPNTAAQLLQFFGVAGSLLTEGFGDNRDYSNSITELGEKIHNFGGWGDVYRENDKTFAWSDPGWWIDNIGGIVDNALPFAIGGAGVAGLLEKAAVGISDMVRLGEAGTRLLRGAAQLGTSAYMSYAEGAQAGVEVFRGVYDKQYQRALTEGLTPDEAETRARHIAAQSAATTVQLNTVLGTALNLSSIAPFFRRSEDVARETLLQALKKQPGELGADWATRVATIKADQYAKQLLEHHGIGAYLQEAAQEGGEEWMNQFTQKTGQDEGEQGRTHGFFDQFGQLEHWFNRTTGQDDALAAVLGAVGGVANTVAVSHLPLKRTTQFADGQHQAVYEKDDAATGAKAGDLRFDPKSGAPVYQKHFASTHNIDKWGTLQAFDSVKDALAADITTHQQLKEDYYKAVQKGDPVAIDMARQELFDPLVLNATRQGMTGIWTDHFQQVADLSPEEAARQGYPADTYREQALKAVSQLEEAQKEYQRLHDKYGLQYQANEGAKQVLDMVFHRHVQLKQWEDMIKDHETKLAKGREEEVKEARVLDPEHYSRDLDEAHRRWATAAVTQDNLKKDHAALQEAVAALEQHPDDKSAQATVDKLIRKWRVSGLNETDKPAAVRRLADRLVKLHRYEETRKQQAEDALYTSSGWIQYQNEHPEATFQEFAASLKRGTMLRQDNLMHEQGLEMARLQHQVAEQEYTELTQPRTLHRFIHKANDWQEQLSRAAEAQEKEHMAQVQLVTKDKAALDRDERIRLDGMAARYRRLRDEQRKIAADQRTLIARLREERDATSKYKDFLRYNTLSRQLRDGERVLREAEAKARYYDTLNQQHTVGTDTVTTPDAQAKETVAAAADAAVADNKTDPAREAAMQAAPEEATMMTDGSDRQQLYRQQVEALHRGEVKDNNGNPVYAEDAGIIANGLDTLTDKPFGHGHIRTSGLASLELLEQLLDGAPFTGDFGKIGNGAYTTWQSGKFIIVSDTLNPLVNGKLDHHHIEVILNAGLSPFARELALKYSDVVFKDFNGRVVTGASDGLTTILPDGDEDETTTISDSVTVEETPEIRYSAMLGDVSQPTRDVLAALETRIRNGEAGRSYDLLNQQVAAGDLNQAEAAQLLAALFDFIDATPPAATTAAAEETTPVSTPVTTTAEEDRIAALEKRWGTHRDVLLYDQAIQMYPEDADFHRGRRLQKMEELERNAGPEKTLSEILAEVTDVQPSATDPFIDPVSNAVEDSPVIALTDDAAIEDSGWRHIGKKAADALTMANTAFEQVRDVLDPKKGGYRKEVDKDKINPDYNEDLLDADKLLADTKIRFEVATGYEGDLKDHNSDATDDNGLPVVIGKDRFTDYTDPQDGRIRPDAVANVPIRIVEVATGKTVGWVKTHRFLHAKLPDTGPDEYRNIVAKFYNDDGTVTDNLAEQNERLLHLRVLIVKQYNNGNTMPVEGTTTGKGPGSLILNWEHSNVSSKLKPALARSSKEELSMLPDPTLKLGIVHHTPGGAPEVHWSKGVRFPHAIAGDMSHLPHGAIVALLPAADGSYYAARLSGQRLADDKRHNTVRSVARAIELYLRNDGSDPAVTDEIAALEGKTKLNIASAEGLRAFINQYYTYTKGFLDSETLAGAEGKESFMFKIGTPKGEALKGRIAVGWSRSGQAPIDATLVNGKLDPRFIAALERGFKSRARAVTYPDSSMGLRGINEASSLPFHDAMFIEDKHGNTHWRHKEYPGGYNEYVKSFSKTVVYGRNQRSDGTYNYVANPSVPYSFTDPARFFTLPDGKKDEGVTPLDALPSQQEADTDDVIGNRWNWSMETPEGAPSIGTGGANSRPLSLATLEELHTFTPEAHRNGRTPLEIYRQLLATGVTYLSEGYNPFQRCL
jgi:hypothetical protein